MVEPLIFSVGKGRSRFRQMFKLLFFRIRQPIGGASATVAVISPRSGDGKTFVATNLAFTASDLGEKSLFSLISAPTTCPAASSASAEATSAENRPGQVSRAGRTGMKIHFYRWAKAENSGGMRLISEIQEFITQMRASYTMVILDTAPLLNNFDAVRLVQNFDAAILVVSKIETPLHEVRSIISLGNLADKTNLTIVMNKVSPQE